MEEQSRPEVKAKIFAIAMMMATAIALLGSTASFASCTAKDDHPAGQYQQATFIPQAPDYNDAAMWVTADGDTDGTGADIFYVVSTTFRLIATHRVHSSLQASVRVVWRLGICSLQRLPQCGRYSQLRALAIQRVSG